MTFTRKFAGGLALALITLVSGCATNNGPFGDRTAVLILNHTPKQILDATATQFQSKGFELKSLTKREAVFERKAGSLQAMAWGGWDGKSAWERADVTVSEYGGGAYLLEADVNLIGDKGDAFFEDKKPMSHRARKPYQEILNEVQKQLQGPPA